MSVSERQDSIVDWYQGLTMMHTIQRSTQSKDMCVGRPPDHSVESLRKFRLFRSAPSSSQGGRPAFQRPRHVHYKPIIIYIYNRRAFVSFNTD